VPGCDAVSHRAGIVYAMENDPHGMIRFSDLVGGKNTKEYKQKQRRAATERIVRDTMIFGVLGWALHAWGVW
jgi:hypothetical protein